MKTPELDLLESSEQSELRAAVRTAVTDGAAAGHETAIGGPWRFTTPDLGLAGLAIAEDLDGVGLGVRELGLVAEELGRCLAAPAFLTSSVVATRALSASDSPAAREALRGLASGTRTAVLVVPGPTTAYDEFPARVQATGADDDVVLTGVVEVVPGAGWADLFVVPAMLDRTPVLALVDGTEHVSVEVEVSLDETRPVATVSLDRTPAAVIARGTHAEEDLRAALNVGAAVLCAERVGIMEWAVTASADYLGQRYQFGQLIGSYQALRHANARMWIDTSQARAITAHALAAHDDDPSELALATGLAAAFTAQRGLLTLEQAQQLHGGIGFTWEHPLHWYLKRAMADSVLFGNDERHRRRVGELTDLIPASG
ncbi:acyl-CoA dehydrogenase family protein [Enemella sp. A6]|uniref:acyl-CoA dehydrogenase family protein n=1 Tax=Enemella sp. A6 TaxID=3440152 RepID=UPI003EBFEDA2